MRPVGRLAGPQTARRDNESASAREAARRRRAAKLRSMTTPLLFPLPFLAIILLWVLAKDALSIPDSRLVSPTDVLASGGELVDLGMLTSDVSLSLKRLAIGALLGTAIGVPIGLALGASRVLSMMFGPFISFFQAISGIALLPLFIMWFGFSETTIQVSILYTALVPIIFSTMDGVRSMPPIYRDAIETMGGNRWQVIIGGYVPGALASIVVGIRLGIAFGWRALIGAEMLIGAGGLGFLIFDSRRQQLVGAILAGMIVIGVLYLIIDRLILAPIEEATVQRWGLQRI